MDIDSELAAALERLRLARERSAAAETLVSSTQEELAAASSNLESLHAGATGPRAADEVAAPPERGFGAYVGERSQRTVSTTGNKVYVRPARGFEAYVGERSQRTGSSRSDNSPEQPRKTGWNTYYPWLLALTGTFSLILLVVIINSWLPSPEIPGVPPNWRMGPLVPGLAGIFLFVFAGRQLYLRGQAKSRQ